MKQSAVMFMVLIGGTLAFAQQPADWRPSIAEDNKAATWADTAAFVTGTINQNPTKLTVNLDSDDRIDWGASQMWMTKHAETSGECFLEIDTFAAIADNYFLAHWRSIVDLKKVDPLSISVSQGPDKTFMQAAVGDFARWNPTVYDKFVSIDAVHKSKSPTRYDHFLTLRYAGTNSAHVELLDSWRYQAKRGSNDTSDQATLFTCEGKPDKCKHEETQVSSGALWVSDEETAKRLARALMHMSLLCGGAKAVSPF